MHVYFVRHGATNLNDRHIHQSPGTPLSPKGQEQAFTVAEYLRSMNPDMLLTSRYTRAEETARIIGKSVGLTPIHTTLFKEVERPTSLCGKSLFCFESFQFVFESTKNRSDTTWRYKDAENFSDIYTRVQRAFKYIESLADEHKSVVIVSHTIFINFMVTYMCHGRMLSLSELTASFFHIGGLKNCDTIELQYVGKPKNEAKVCNWIKIK